MRKYTFCQFPKNILARIYKSFNFAKTKDVKVRIVQNVIGLKAHRQISKEHFRKVLSL